MPSTGPFWWWLLLDLALLVLAGIGGGVLFLWARRMWARRPRRTTAGALHREVTHLTANVAALSALVAQLSTDVQAVPGQLAAGEARMDKAEARIRRTELAHRNLTQRLDSQDRMLADLIQAQSAQTVLLREIVPIVRELHNGERISDAVGSEVVRQLLPLLTTRGQGPGTTWNVGGGVGGRDVNQASGGGVVNSGQMGAAATGSGTQTNHAPPKED